MFACGQRILGQFTKAGRKLVGIQFFCIRLRMQILDIHNSNHTWMNILFLQLGQFIPILTQNVGLLWGRNRLISYRRIN